MINYLKNIPEIWFFKDENSKEFSENPCIFKKLFKREFEFNFEFKSKFVFKDGYAIFDWKKWEFDMATEEFNFWIPENSKLKLELELLNTYVSKIFKKDKTFLKIKKQESPDFVIKVKNDIFLIECTRWGDKTNLAFNEANSLKHSDEKFQSLSDNKQIKIAVDKNTVYLQKSDIFPYNLHNEYNDIENLIKLIRKKAALNYFKDNEITLLISIEVISTNQCSVWQNLVVDFPKQNGTFFKKQYRRPIDYVLDKANVKSNNIKFVFFYHILVTNPNSIFNYHELVFEVLTPKTYYISRKRSNYQSTDEFFKKHKL